MKRSEPNRKANLCVARGVPVFLLGILGYALWVVTKLICVNYLLQPRPPFFPRSRPGPAIAILTILYLLLIFLLACYGRLIDVVARHPGFVPYGRHWYAENIGKKQRRPSRPGLRAKQSSEEKSISSTSTQGHERSKRRRRPSDAAIKSGDWAAEFWKKDVFVCKYDGRPQFCSTCRNWKPDRAHHCSEVNRCVLKMDHFCPWVGGVVGETSFKFFIQFTFAGALINLHMLVTVAYFFAQRRRIEGTVDVHWAVTLALASLFFLFSGGMCASSLHFALVNSTTIENLDRTRKRWCLAIYIPQHKISHVQDTVGPELRMITYPRPPSEQLHMIDQSQSELGPAAAAAEQSTPPSQATDDFDSVPVGECRTFGIFTTEPGENPFSLGLFKNFQDIMGVTVWEWMLPIHPSPCSDHRQMESFYKTGPVVDRIRLATGISEDSKTPRPEHHKRKRRRRRSDARRTEAG